MNKDEAEAAKEKAFDDIDKIWFFVLNSLFKIKDEQTRVLEKLINQKQEGLKLIKKSEQFKLGVANKKIASI